MRRDLGNGHPVDFVEFHNQSVHGVGMVGLLAAWLQGLSAIPDKPRGFVFTCY